MNKQDIIRDLKAVCFDIIYSQVKEVLNDETSSTTLDKLQKTITSVDNLLSTLEDTNLVKEETNSEETSTSSIDNTSISSDDNSDEIKVETYQEDTSNNELVQDKTEDESEQNIEEKEENSVPEEVNNNVVDNNQTEDKEPESKDNKSTIDYELEEYYRLTNNPVKAIIVNVNQLRKLRESLTIQKERLDFGVIAVTPNTNASIETKKPSIEELLEQASRLYKEGKILESEKLYEQIRNMNQVA